VHASLDVAMRSEREPDGFHSTVSIFIKIHNPIQFILQRH